MPRLVPVTRVSNGFHANVIAARLGADGIVAQVRGGLASPYPAGDVEVLVDESELDDAVALLLADEIESSFEPGAPSSRPRWIPWTAVLLLACMLIVGDIIAIGVRP